MKKIRARIEFVPTNILFLIWIFVEGNIFAEDSLTLQKCLILGRENNSRLIEAQKSIESARAGVTSAYSSYYPSLNLSSGYNKGSVEEGNYSSSVGLKYSFYPGGYTIASTRIAKSRFKLAEENYRLTESEVFLNIKEAFLNILQKQEQLVVVEEVLNRRKEALTLIRLKYNAGRESAPAVSGAEADLLQAEYDKMSAEEELHLAKVKLNLLLGQPARKEILLEYKEENVEFPSREKLIEEAKTLRPDIRIESENKDVLEAQLKQAKSDYFPTLSLSSSYGYNGNSFSEQFSEQEGSWNAGVSLSLPIFNGFLTQAKVKSALSELQGENAKVRNIEESIEEDIEEAYSNWLLARKNLEVNIKAREAEQDMYQLTRLQYEQGQTTYFVLQQKELSLTRAGYSYINALFNFRITCARLQKVWGK